MYIFLISLFGNVIPFYLISWSEIFIDSNLAGLLLSIAPIFALISSHFLTSDDKFTLMKFLATIFGFIGIIILLGFDNLKLVFQGDYLLILPKIAVIIAAFGYVISSIFAYNLKKINTISLTTMVLIFASLMSLPFMLIYEINNFSIPDNKSIIAVCGDADKDIYNRLGLKKVYTILDKTNSIEKSMENAEKYLTEIGADILDNL